MTSGEVAVQRAHADLEPLGRGLAIAAAAIEHASDVVAHVRIAGLRERSVSVTKRVGPG